MAVNVSRYCTRTSVWNLCSQKWKVLQLRVLFLGFFFHNKRADRGCLICCDEMFSFCNTKLILTSAAPAAEEAGHAHAAGCPAALLELLLQAGEGCPTDGLPSWMQFPWLVMFAREPGSQHFHLTQKTCPWTKITLLLHTSYCSSLLLKSSPT